MTHVPIPTSKTYKYSKEGGTLANATKDGYGFGSIGWHCLYQVRYLTVIPEQSKLRQYHHALH
jgi:hypothetical protein